MRTQPVISMEALKHYTPAAFGTPSENVSNRYAYVPTHEVLTMLHDEGFVITKAVQTGYRNNKSDFGKHMIRLRHRNFENPQELGIGGLIPEIVMINSHDAKSSFKIMAGLFRLVCLNGMIVPQGPNQKNVIRHFGNAEQVVNAVFDVVKTVPLVMNNAKEMSTINLTEVEKDVFANAASELRWPTGEIDAPKRVNPQYLLTPKRHDDNKNDLWTTFSVVQENMLKGGTPAYNRGRMRRSKPIKAINEDVRLNKALWMLADQMKQIKLEEAA